MKRILQSLIVCAGVLGAGGVLAQGYPAKPIRMLVGFAPGGSTDLVARVMARHLEKGLGQSVIVENRPGAAGTIAANAVAKAEPDGYTLLFSNITTMAPVLVKNGAVVGGKDLAPVASVSISPFLLFVRGDLPVHTLADLAAYAKAHPGKLNHGSTSSVNLLGMEALKGHTGITFTNIPYKGAGPLTLALVSGELDVSLDSLPSYLPFLQTGKVRALFIAPERSALVPDGARLPTAAEAGIPNFDVALPLTIWAPPGTSAAIRERVSAEVRVALRNPEVVEQLAKVGAMPAGSTPDGLMQKYDAELKFWTAAARLANFEPQ